MMAKFPVSANKGVVRTAFDHLNKHNSLLGKRKSCGLLFLLAFLVVCSAQAQISYEPGYFIDSSGEKTACLIRNVDWMKNPSSFQYKLTEDGKVLTANLESFKEFGVTAKSKYVRATVDLDSSSDDVDKLGMAREPLFSEKTLFLKVLVEGKASLFVYDDNNGSNYYYKTDSSTIQPLIFKRYITASNRVAENNQYKQELRNALNYPNLNQKRLANLRYRKRELTNLFFDYNTYHGGTILDLEKGEKRKWFNLIIRPGIHYSSVKFEALRSTAFNRDLEIDFDNELSFRLGIELEAIMPFNKGKWAIMAEPFYEMYKSELAVNDSQNAAVDYKYFGMSVGVRHYFFLNNKSKLFINGSAVVAFGGNSDIKLSSLNREIEKGTTVAMGLGYAYNNKFYVELRHTFDRQLLKYQLSKAQYSGQSLILGYNLF